MSHPGRPRRNLTAFVDIVTGEQAWFDTRVALLWDDEYLYFGFWVEETDVWGTLTERDSKIYEENDVEIFIAGQGRVLRVRDQRAEHRLRSLLDLEGRPARDRWRRVRPRDRSAPWCSTASAATSIRARRALGISRLGFPGPAHRGPCGRQWSTAAPTPIVGWTVELAFPWKGMDLIADGRTLPPKDGDVWRIDCSRFEKIGPPEKRWTRAPAGPGTGTVTTTRTSRKSSRT